MSNPTISQEIHKFEKNIGPCVIKGEADPKTGMIKGEIGINNPITGYSSIKPFAGSLDKGIGEKIHVLGQDESFSIRKDGNAVKAQLNLNSGGTGIVLFEWESKVQMVLQLSQDRRQCLMWNYNSFTYLTLPPYLVRNGNIPVTVTFTNLEKLGDGGSFKGKIKGKDISFSLYNQYTNAKVEGKIPEDLAFSDNDFDGQYGPHPDQD